jgi:heme-binding protein
LRCGFGVPPVTLFSRMKKKILTGFVVVFVAVQFVRPAKNLSAAPPGPNDLVTRYGAPPEVKKILEVACYDCHSNRTRYPWYAEVEPNGWWLASHIRDGKDNLNFNEFAGYSKHTQAKKLEAIGDELTGHTMPLNSYTWIHKDAILSEAQIKLLTDWTEDLKDKIEPDK